MSCVEIEDISQESWKNWAVKEGMFTPLRTEKRLSQQFLTSYGFGPFLPKIMIYNPNDFEVVIKKHEKIGEFHPIPSELMNFSITKEQMKINENKELVKLQQVFK
jgi:hypothetical protein